MFAPIFVTPSGISRFVTREPFRYRLCAYCKGFELVPYMNPMLHHLAISDIYTPFKLLQPLNAYFSMLVTPFPITIVVKAEQPENAYSPMPVTSSKSVTLVKPEQP